MSLKVAFAIAMVALLVAGPARAAPHPGKLQYRKLLQSLNLSGGTNLGVAPSASLVAGGGPLSSRGDFTSTANVRDNTPPLASGSFNSARGGDSSGAPPRSRGGLSSSVEIGGRH